MPILRVEPSLPVQSDLGRQFHYRRLDGRDAGPPSVEAFVEYCRIQAGLLSGSVETMAAEADDLLEEIDERIAELRTRLRERPHTEGTVGPSSTDDPDGTGVDVAASRIWRSSFRFRRPWSAS